MFNYYAKKLRQQLGRHGCLIALFMLIAAAAGTAFAVVRALPPARDACQFDSQGTCDAANCCSWSSPPLPALAM